MSISVRNRAGDEIIDITLDDLDLTVGDIKRQIEWFDYHYQLTYQGETLDNNNEKIADLGICPESVLYIINKTVKCYSDIGFLGENYEYEGIIIMVDIENDKYYRFDLFLDDITMTVDTIANISESGVISTDYTNRIQLTDGGRKISDYYVQADELSDGSLLLLPPSDISIEKREILLELLERCDIKVEIRDCYEGYCKDQGIGI